MGLVGIAAVQGNRTCWLQWLGKRGQQLLSSGTIGYYWIENGFRLREKLPYGQDSYLRKKLLKYKCEYKALLLVRMNKLNTI